MLIRQQNDPLGDKLEKHLIEPRRRRVITFHNHHYRMMRKAAGSSHNHQDWPGGYYDHIDQCLDLAEHWYNGFEHLPFLLDSAIFVLYFHDIEKMFKYQETPEVIDKETWYDETLDEEFKVRVYEEEKVALKYIHGEGEDYRKDRRVMNELGAFCHCVDVASARIFHQMSKAPIRK